MLRLRTFRIWAAAVLAATGCSDESSTQIAGYEGDASPGSEAGIDAGAETGADVLTDGPIDSSADAPADSEVPTAPQIVVPGDQSIDEDQTLSLSIQVKGSSAGLRVSASGLPEGARWQEDQRRIVFTPDFIQGGQSWEVTVTARNGAGVDTATFSVSVNDTIQPPWPTITKTETSSGYKSLWIAQKTDSYLDSPGYAGRTLTARVIVPDGATTTKRMPVRVYLHGLGGSPYDGTSSGGQFRIYPHDPMNSYWWGYASSLPGTPSGTVPNYTQRRVLHLLEWLLHEQPGADPDRVYVTGGSMGGAGAATLGLLYARHFAYSEATVGQTVPRNHRPARISQLTTLWGSPSANLPDGTALEDGAPMGVWDRQDLCRVLRDWPESRTLHIQTKHGKDDPTIHFGAISIASPLTGRAFLDALRDHRVGHYVVWDEGGHGSADPVMPAGWWDDGWSTLFDSKSWLRRGVAFPAFTFADHDWDPGDGTGNGKQSWSDASGYAGAEDVAGDTGWDGDIAGARNRFLRWDSNGVVDTAGELRIPLFVVNAEGSAPPKAGYPSIGDRFDRELPVTVDVTIRRARGFACRPGESVHWTFGAASGDVKADEEGAVTVPKLAIGVSPEELVLSR